MSDEEKIREIIAFFLLLYAPDDWEEILNDNTVPIE